MLLRSNHNHNDNGNNNAVINVNINVNNNRNQNKCIELHTSPILLYYLYHINKNKGSLGQ